MDRDEPLSNRDRKVQGREKRRGYRQGTRSYLHAMVNSMARRAAEHAGKKDERDKKDR